MTVNPLLKPYEDRVVAWASAHPPIRAAIICGSSERVINPADDWSDLDFELYVTGFDEFGTNADWLNDFGSLWMHLFFQEAEGPVFLAVYEAGHKIDLHFHLLKDLEQNVSTQTLPASCERGYRVVVDKDGLAQKLPAPRMEPPVHGKPSQEAFIVAVNTFWYSALAHAKQIRRRSLWTVKASDWRLKQSLLQIMEWHAQSTHGWCIDSWHEGKYIEQWADPAVLDALNQAFAHFDVADSWRALFATMDIFRRLGRELARNAQYAYPDNLDHQITGLIESLMNTDDAQARTSLSKSSMT
jgi:aminoglycoside 6-adenylyltransferase